MNDLLLNFEIKLNQSIYLKDPESSDLGKKILDKSIALIESIGFEAFTFQKLGKSIGSNESSVYRYFENKHMLLIYLTSWYWAWIEYQLVIETHSIQNKKEKLIKAINLLTRTIKQDTQFSHINQKTLNRIIIKENLKSFLTNEVDDENEKGYFEIYKRLVLRLKNMILDINSKYKYPTSLASTIIESGLHQHFLKDHMTKITDCNSKIRPADFLTDMVLKAIR